MVAGQYKGGARSDLMDKDGREQEVVANEQMCKISFLEGFMRLYYETADNCAC